MCACIERVEGLECHPKDSQEKILMHSYTLYWTVKALRWNIEILTLGEDTTY